MGTRNRTLRVAMLALLLAGPLAFGAAPRCAPPAEHSCCAAASSCCCGDAGECTCSAGSEQQPTAPEPAAPQRQGEEQKSSPVLTAVVAAQPAPPALVRGASLHTEAGCTAAPPVLDHVVLRC
jgi:hypothetical protein